MAFLFLIVCLVFSFIFYIFSRLEDWEAIFSWSPSFYNLDSLSWNLIIETLVFFIIWLYLFFAFSKFSSWTEKNEEKISGFNLEILKKYSSTFFQKYLYYIGFVFFYIWIYFVFRGINITDFWYFIFFVNLLIALLFFITKKLFIFRDFIKINTILFSLYYIFSYVYFFLTNDTPFSQIDLLNSFLIFFFFIISIYFDKKILKKEVSDTWLISYFFLYGFLFSSFYFYQAFPNTSFIFSVNLFFLSMFIFHFITKLSFFTNSNLVLKYIWLIFNYFSIVFAIYFTLNYSLNLIIFFVLIYSIWFNFSVHRSFENYICLFFSSWTLVFIIYYLFFNYISLYDIKEIVFLSLSISFSFCIILISYISKLKYFYENYFYHVFSYLLNFISVVYFFFTAWFDIFVFWVILIFESIFVFLSYYKLKNIKIEN